MVVVVRLIAEFLGKLLYYTRPFPDVVFHYIYSFFMGKTKSLPPIENEILLMSATKLADKIRNRELKSEEVVKAFVARAQVVQPYINAITDARYEEALEDARAVDRFLDEGQKSPEEIEENTPLLGVPFSCKEALGVKDLAQTAGLVKAKDRKCEKSSDSAAQYIAAGAIPVTVTNVPELCVWWTTSNFNFGMCKNPYNNHRTVGGSTGGEGALLTAAGAVIGIGTDIGGSIRMPACFNGIYGHKPSSGVVSNAGLYPENEEVSITDHINSTGPLCRYAEDLPLLLSVLSAKDERLRLKEKVDLRKVKVYYMETFPGTMSAISAVRNAVRMAANYFKETYDIKPILIKMPELEHAFPLWESKYLETGVSPFKTLLTDEKGKANLWWELAKNIFGCSEHIFPAIFYSMIEKRDKDSSYYECLSNHNRIEQQFSDIFKEDALVLVPSHPELPPFYHLTIPKFLDMGYTAIFNTLGYPVTSIPAGLCDGLPIGIQAVSARFNDHLTIAAAQELEKCFGGWKGPSAISV